MSNETKTRAVAALAGVITGVMLIGTTGLTFMVGEGPACLSGREVGPDLESLDVDKAPEGRDVVASKAGLDEVLMTRAPSARRCQNLANELIVGLAGDRVNAHGACSICRAGPAVALRFARTPVDHVARL